MKPIVRARLRVAVVAVTGTLPGALIGFAFVLFGGLIEDAASTNALLSASDATQSAGLSVAAAHRTAAMCVAIATAIALATSWAAVWFDSRKRPETSTISPSLVALATVAGSFLAGWLLLAPFSSSSPAFQSIAFLVVFIPFAIAYAATIPPRSAGIRIASSFLFVAIIALSYYAGLHL
jgi:hypothetical protein